MEKKVVWYSIHNDGAGAAFLEWFMYKEDAEYDQDNLDEGWGEPCIGSVETFEHSDIWGKAFMNSSKQLQNREDEEFLEEMN